MRWVRKYRFTLILAVLLVMWLAVGPQLIERLTNSPFYRDGLPTEVELSGILYYTQEFDGVWQLDLSTGIARRWWLPPDGGLATGIAASPDQTQLAIAYAPPAEGGIQSGTTDLYLSDVAQPDLQPLLIRANRSESFRNPAWSPDGDWLYYSHLQPGPGGAGLQLQVERLALSGEADTAPEVILSAAEQPALSPDGAQVTFLKFDARTYRSGLWLSDLDGGNAVELVPSASFAALAGPRFTPEGDMVIVGGSGELQGKAAAQTGGGMVRAHGEPWNLWAVSVDEVSLSPLTPTTLDGPLIDWSPDGQHMAVLSAEGVFVVVDGQYYRLSTVTSEGAITWVDTATATD